MTAATLPNDAAPDQAPPIAPTPHKPPLSARLKLDRIPAFLWSRQARTVPTVMTFLMLPVLLSLGTWQVTRMAWKNTVLHDMEKNLAEAPVDLRAAPPVDAPAWTGLHQRGVMLQGHWLNLRNFKLGPRTYEGQAGYQLIVPLRLQDDQIVLVNRGFVPAEQNIMPVNNDNELVAVTGVARVMESEKPFGLPQNNPARGVWTWTDLEAMGHETGFAHVAPVMVYETRVADRDSFPIGGQVPLPDHNRHWHYAITWYALAIILTGVYVMSMSPRKNKDADAKPAEAMDPVAQRSMYPEATD